jgi:hypothetical protein
VKVSWSKVVTIFGFVVFLVIQHFAQSPILLRDGKSIKAGAYQ